MKVLLLDDDQKRIELLKEMLSDQDYEILIEKDGKEAVKHLTDDSPKLIIANFDAPDGGIDLVNSILTLNKEQFPYVLFMTEEEGESNAIDCLGPIPGDFLLKPIKMQELEARISIAERAIAMQNHLRVTKGAKTDLALYDELTNVLNRQAVYERALGELNRAQREKLELCMAMIEVINFKDIETRYDLDTANQAIRYVARTVRANVRMYDLVGRWIGSKFFLMMPNLPQENIRSVIERIYVAITSVRVKYTDDTSIPIEIAVGYTWSDVEAPAPLYVLIERVNDALKEASSIKDEMKVVPYQEV